MQKKKSYLVILLLKQNSSKAYIEPKVEGKLQGLLLVATTRLLPWWPDLAWVQRHGALYRFGPVPQKLVSSSGGGVVWRHNAGGGSGGAEVGRGGCHGHRVGVVPPSPEHLTPFERRSAEKWHQWRHEVSIIAFFYTESLVLFYFF